MYKERAKLKHVRVSDLYPDSTAATWVESGRIFLNKNLTSYRRDILKQVNHAETLRWFIDNRMVNGWENIC